MKKFLFFLFALMLTTGLSAQSIFNKMTTKGYNRVYLEYNPVNVSWEDPDWGSRLDLRRQIPIKNGFSLGYLRGSNIVKSLPLYIEYGANVQYTFGSYKDKEYDWVDGVELEFKTKARVDLFSINVPVNVAFRFSFADNKLSVTPYAGLNFRFNVAGSLRQIAETEIDGEDMKITNKLKLFSDDELDYSEYDDALEDVYATGEIPDNIKIVGGIGSEDYLDGETMKRIQVGFNFGVAFNYKAFHLGVGYTADFNKFVNAEEAEIIGRLGMTKLSIGVTF